MIKPKNVSWRDWWASRTNRFNSYWISFNSIVMPVIISIDEADLEALGVSERAIVIAMIVLNIVAGWQNQQLRAKTSTPLVGRSEASAEEIMR